MPSSSPHPWCADADGTLWPWKSECMKADTGRPSLRSTVGGWTYPQADDLHDQNHVQAWLDRVDEELVNLRRLQSANDATWAGIIAGAPVAILGVGLSLWGLAASLGQHDGPLGWVGSVAVLAVLVYAPFLGIRSALLTSTRPLGAGTRWRHGKAVHDDIDALIAIRACYRQRLRRLDAGQDGLPLWGSPWNRPVVTDRETPAGPNRPAT